MHLIPVDLPSLDELRNRWAAHAAVMAAIGCSDLSHATSQRWHYDDAGGNWAELVLLDNGRAVLCGHDHEYSETYFREAAVYFQEEETDLLADAPDWWEAGLPAQREQWIGFVYGFDGTSWFRAEYDLDDGFVSVGLPAVSFDRTYDMVSEFVLGRAEAHDVDHEVDVDAVRALTISGASLTHGELVAIFGEVPADLDAGVAAARSFS
jgi:hypothetical protein